MAKEDFKDGKQPIDMDDYPYQAGDKLSDGTIILAVIKGDINDSFGGYQMRSIVDVKGTKRIYGDDFIIKSTGHTDREGRNALKDEQNWPGNTIDVELVGIVPNPWAQRVIFKLPKKGGTQYMTPEEFLEFAKNGSKPTFPPDPPGEPDKESEIWSAGEDDYIKEHYQTMTDEEMATTLQVDVKSLKEHRLKDLKLKKQPFGG
jgi:hypothetical protein